LLGELGLPGHPRVPGERPLLSSLRMDACSHECDAGPRQRSAAGAAWLSEMERACDARKDRAEVGDAGPRAAPGVDRSTRGREDTASDPEKRHATMLFIAPSASAAHLPE